VIEEPRKNLRDRGSDCVALCSWVFSFDTMQRSRKNVGRKGLMGVEKEEKNGGIEERFREPHKMKGE